MNNVTYLKSYEYSVHVYLLEATLVFKESKSPILTMPLSTRVYVGWLVGFDVLEEVEEEEEESDALGGALSCETWAIGGINLFSLLTPTTLLVSTALLSSFIIPFSPILASSLLSFALLLFSKEFDDVLLLTVNPMDPGPELEYGGLGAEFLGLVTVPVFFNSLSSDSVSSCTSDPPCVLTVLFVRA